MSNRYVDKLKQESLQRLTEKVISEIINTAFYIVWLIVTITFVYLVRDSLQQTVLIALISAISIYLKEKK